VPKDYLYGESFIRNQVGKEIHIINLFDEMFAGSNLSTVSIIREICKNKIL